MEKERLLLFVKELIDVQERHGITVTAGYTEEIEYDWNEQPYVSSINPMLVYTDFLSGEETYECELPYKK